MSDPDLKCGEYLGRAPAFADDSVDAVAFVGGEALYEFVVESVPDFACEGMA